MRRHKKLNKVEKRLLSTEDYTKLEYMKKKKNICIDRYYTNNLFLFLNDTKILHHTNFKIITHQLETHEYENTKQKRNGGRGKYTPI